MLKLQLVQQSIVASIVLLACTLQAAQLFNSPVNPRGWQVRASRPDFTRWLQEYGRKSKTATALLCAGCS